MAYSSQLLGNYASMNGEKLNKPGLLICKFSNKEEFNLTWPGGQTRQVLIRYINSSIRKFGRFSEQESLEIEVSYVDEKNIVNWRSVTLDELIDDPSINIIRITKVGDEGKKTIQENSSRILSLKNCKKNSMNQVRYVQLMSQQKEERSQYKKVTLDELKSHRNINDCWIAYKGKVYDVTKYLDFHPGGKDILLQFAGMDVTDACNHFHHWVNCEGILKSSCIGFLEK